MVSTVGATTSPQAFNLGSDLHQNLLRSPSTINPCLTKADISEMILTALTSDGWEPNFNTDWFQFFLYAATNSPKHNKWVGVYICGVEVPPSTINPCKALSDKLWHPTHGTEIKECGRLKMFNRLSIRSVIPLKWFSVIPVRFMALMSFHFDSWSGV